MTDIATLSRAEQIALTDCEERIERGLKTFVEVGHALAAIKESRLYRAEHETFEAYCTARWSISARHANRSIEAAAVVESMGPIGLAPENEAQARELAKVPEPERADVWREAVERTEGKPTAAAVRAVHNERTQTPGPVDKVSPVDPGTTYVKAVADFPELEHYADRPAKAAALADQLRSFEPTEQATRRETLGRVIQAERTGRLGPKPDPAADALDLADRLFVAVNEAAQVAEKIGGVEAIEAAVAHADPAQIELWRDQFTNLAATLADLASACRPQLRRVQ